MLNSYISTTQRLLQNPSSASAKLYTNADLTIYINLARQQMAAETECVRTTATLALVNGTISYPFNTVTVPSGYQSIISARIISVSISGTPTLMDGRPWEWFFAYYLSNGAVASGVPARWAQQGQGLNGTIFFNPTPNGSYTASIDAACVPINLVDDTTTEVIPYPWTDAVPYYAAYYALMGAQRVTDADVMFRRYQQYARRGREETTPTVLPGNMPGDMGAEMAAQKITLDMPQQQGQGGG